MIAYGVWTHDWEDSRLHALYATREQAEKHCKALNADPIIQRARKTDLAGYERWHSRVEEHTVFDAFNGLVVDAS